MIKSNKRIKNDVSDNKYIKDLISKYSKRGKKLYVGKSDDFYNLITSKKKSDLIQRKKIVANEVKLGDASIITLQDNVIPSDFLGITFLSDAGNLGSTIILIPSLLFFTKISIGGKEEAKQTQRRVIIHEYMHAVLAMSGVNATLGLSELAEHALIYALDGELSKLSYELNKIGV